MKYKLQKLIISVLLVGFVLGCKNSMTTLVKIGYVSPQTGDLKAFAEADDFIIQRVLEAMNSKKIRVDGKIAEFKIITVNTESDFEKTKALTEKLILEDKVNIIVSGSTTENNLPVSIICEKYEIPYITTISPLTPWLLYNEHNYGFHFFWDINDVINVFLDIWERANTNKIVGGFWPDDYSGEVWSAEFTKALIKNGYKVVELGAYPKDTTDFSKIINSWKAQQVEIITGIAIPGDFETFWKQTKTIGYTPKVAAITKAMLFPSIATAMGGDLAQGITSEVWWSPDFPYKSSLTNETARHLTNVYPKQWTQPLGYTYALFEIAFDAFSRAQSTNKMKVLNAISTTQLNTLVGHIAFNKQHVAKTPVVGGQWVKGETYPWNLKIISNLQAPEIPITGNLELLRN